MITVNNQNYDAFGGKEGKMRYDAQHNTYDYIEDRLIYSDMVELNILVDMLWHAFDDVISKDVVDKIKEEINQVPIDNNTPENIKEKVQDVILDNVNINHDKMSNIDSVIEDIVNILARLKQQEDSIQLLRIEILNLRKEINNIKNKDCNCTCNKKFYDPRYTIDYQERKKPEKKQVYRRELFFPYYNNPITIEYPKKLYW